MRRITDKQGNAVEVSDELATVVYAPEELAERLKISRNKAYDLIKDGKLNYCTVGSTYRVSELAVQRFELGFPPLAA